MSKSTLYADLADLEEDQRIAAIGNLAMAGKTVAFIVEDDGGDKAARYIGKLRERFPGIVILGRIPGPIAKVLTVKVGPPGSAPH